MRYSAKIRTNTITLLHIFIVFYEGDVKNLSPISLNVDISLDKSEGNFLQFYHYAGHLGI